MTILQTHRTTISPLHLSDSDDIYTLYSNAEVRKYLGGTLSKADCIKKIEKLLSFTSPESAWSVREKDSDTFIGLMSISSYHETGHYEISYQLSPNFRRRGFGSEVVGELIQYVFEKTGLRELYAETQKKNTPSRRLLERVGMTFVSEVERCGETQSVYKIKA